MSAPVQQDAWQGAETTPEAIDAALRDMLYDRHSENASFVPARVLNLVVIVDRAYRGEIINRLERLDRFHPSRTIVCAVENARQTLDAWATLDSDAEPAPGMLAVCRERVELAVGPGHLEHLDRVVTPVLAPDLPTIVWAPHGHDEALQAMLAAADVVLLDSDEASVGGDALARAAGLSERAYVVDLAWLRSTPWRERVAAAFDPSEMRGTLADLADVTVHPRRDSPPRACCSSAGWRRGWAGSRVGSRRRRRRSPAGRRPRPVPSGSPCAR